MPGLSQLQQLKSDLLNLGDEVKIRASRGEKPSEFIIPPSIEDRDDSNDFKFGLPVPKDPDADSNEPAAPVEEEPAMSDADILASLGDDIDLSAFSDMLPAAEPEPKPEPLQEAKEPAPLEDMDFASLMASSPENTEETPADDIPLDLDSLDSIDDINFDGLEDSLTSDFDSTEPEEIPSQEISSEDNLFNMDSLPDESGLSDMEDLNSDFEDSIGSLDMNDSLPEEMNEESEVIPEEPEEQTFSPEAETLSGENFLKEDSDSGMDLGGIDDLNIDNLGDLGDIDDISADSTEDLSSIGDFSDLGDISFDGDDSANTSSADDDLGNISTDDISDTDFSSDSLSTDGIPEDEFGSLEDAFDPTESVEAPSAEESVPDPDDSTFDTSNLDGIGNIDGMDFGESFDENDFHIPGFSDTTSVDISKKPDIATADFSNAAEAEDKDKPRNTFTDKEYQRFMENLEEYPLNVRIALEDLIVKNEFTDDAVFEVLEKVLRKVSARQLASELEKLLDITLNVPRDFERRSAKEYDNYKKSLEYQLKNRIIPGAIMTAAAAIMIFCIFTLTNTFIYKPLRALSLYKQGYTLIQKEQYPQSEAKFNQALTYKPVKKWFYTYAHGYQDHRQYDRARKMYKVIIQRFNHEKKAGLEWAALETDYLNNYEEAERILKREVLDYHINDADAILQHGDNYLEWGTEKDPSKLELAKEQYDLYDSLFGQTNSVLARKMIFYIRSDNLRQVLAYRNHFTTQKKGLNASQKTELSGYLLDKRYGKLRPSEENLRSEIEGLRDLLESALKDDKTNPIAYYNMARYFIETSNPKMVQKFLENSIKLFEAQTHRKRRDTYKYIDSFRLLGEEMKAQKEYLMAEEYYGNGISLFEKENKASGFESNPDIGHLYADLGDLDYFIACDNETALANYENAVNNKWDTSSVRYKIGYIQYSKQNYRSALGSFIKSKDTSETDTHLLLALANTLSLSSDNHVAKGYYERLLSILDAERSKYAIVLPQVRDDHADIVDTYMKASNNLGVTLTRLASMTGDSRLNAQGIVHMQESLRAWDALTRNQKTMIRLEGSNLAEQNIKFITHPTPDYECEIYTEIPRTLNGEEVLE